MTKLIFVAAVLIFGGSGVAIVNASITPPPGGAAVAVAQQRLSGQQAALACMAQPGKSVLDCGS